MPLNCSSISFKWKNVTMSLPDSIWESSKQPFIKAKEEFIFEWEIYEKKIEKWKEQQQQKKAVSTQERPWEFSSSKS